MELRLRGGWLSVCIKSHNVLHRLGTGRLMNI